jgi:taurine-pyruvate aminotransferase
MGKLGELMEKHQVIGDVRGKGLFCGAELVADRETREPLNEALVQKVVGHCMQQGIIIGATNRSLPGYNNTLCFSPALISTTDDLDHVAAGVDAALTDVMS